jgi:lipoprotein LprG
MNLFRNRFLVTVLLATLALVLAACNGDDADDELDANDIIENASESFEETSSAHFTLDIDGSIGIDDAGMIELGSVSGEIERPANARADANVVFGGSSVTMEMIASDGEMFMRNILTGDWERAPSDLQYDPARIFDEEEGVASIIDQLEDVELVGEESVNGTDAWHLTGQVNADAVRALAGDFFEGDTLDVDIWVEREDYRLLRVELHDVDADEPVSWELELSNHDEDVEITPPDLD